jgi:uncharacterized membrane protein/protein-disulfide isomerase
MSILNNFLKHSQHCEDSTIYLIKSLGVKVSDTTIQKDLIEHPNYPSLLSISDVLNNYAIDSVAAKLAFENFSQLKTPFLVHINGKRLQHSLFAVLNKFNVEFVEIYNPESRKVENILIKDFEKIYKGTVLAVEVNENAGEKEYKKNITNEKQKSFFVNIALLSIPLLTVFMSGFALYNNFQKMILPVIYALLTLAGFIVSSLLILSEIDAYNPAIKQICNVGKKINCAAILNSKGSKIFGISWSSLGFTYFMGILLILLVGGGLSNVSTFYLLGWLQLPVLSYIFYSIYYQWRIVKQWCLLCLIVQAVLALQFIIFLLMGTYSTNSFSLVPLDTYFAIISSFVIIFVVTTTLIPALEKAKENKSKTTTLQRLKHNTQIFEALLEKQKFIGDTAVGLGIVKGNPNAKNKIVKVCNPYCGPCAQAHKVLEDLLQNNPDIELQIIFTASDNETDRKAPPVKHLLAIAEMGNEKLTQQALDDWYLAEKKDYDLFALKYPLNGELQKQSEKVKAMREWCSKVTISFTPTVFVNGYQLPEIYTIDDLKYFLSS